MKKCDRTALWNADKSGGFESSRLPGCIMYSNLNFVRSTSQDMIIRWIWVRTVGWPQVKINDWRVSQHRSYTSRAMLQVTSSSSCISNTSLYTVLTVGFIAEFSENQVDITQPSFNAWTWVDECEGLRAVAYTADRLWLRVKLWENKPKLAATLRGSRPGVQSASLIMTSLVTS